MDIDDWQPPSEAEMKIIKARQDRSNKISRIMSTYLLKGYKMLGIICATCETILLQDRQGQNYCVACSELDSEEDKDNPVVNQAAASSLARELSSKVKETTVTSSTPGPAQSLSGGDVISIPPSTASPLNTISHQPALARSIKVENLENDGTTGTAHSTFVHEWLNEDIEGATDRQVPCCTSRPVASSHNVSILLEKVNWACQAVRETRDLDYTLRLCQIIKAAAEAIAALRKSNL